MIYTPDNWVVLKINVADRGDLHYRVLGGWSGGYTTGDSWRLNSGITSVLDGGDYFTFHGPTGSEYECHKETYGLRMNNAHIAAYYLEEYPGMVELMPEDTDWVKLFS